MKDCCQYFISLILYKRSQSFEINPVADACNVNSNTFKQIIAATPVCSFETEAEHFTLFCSVCSIPALRDIVSRNA